MSLPRSNFLDQPSPIPLRPSQTQSSRTPSSSGNSWLTSFTDLAALMLTFFVLQFSMSTLDALRWDDLLQSFRTDRAGLAGGPDPLVAPNPGSSRPETIPGRDLNYLASVLEEQLRAEGLIGLVDLQKGEGYLRMRLPAAVFSDTPGNDAAALYTARRAVAAILGRLENDIALVAYTRPADTRLRRADWSEALSKARMAAESLAAAGFGHPIATSGQVVTGEAALHAASYDILIYAGAEEGA